MAREHLNNPFEYQVQLTRKEKEEIDEAITALSDFQKKFRQEILTRKKGIDSNQVKRDQRKKAVISGEGHLQTADLLKTIDEFYELGKENERLTQEQNQAWDRLNYSHPPLSEKLLDKLPNGSEIKALREKIKNPQSIKLHYQENPSLLFFHIDDAILKLRKLML